MGTSVGHISCREHQLYILHAQKKKKDVSLFLKIRVHQQHHAGGYVATGAQALAPRRVNGVCFKKAKIFDLRTQCYCPSCRMSNLSSLVTYFFSLLTLFSPLSLLLENKCGPFASELKGCFLSVICITQFQHRIFKGTGEA